MRGGKWRKRERGWHKTELIIKKEKKRWDVELHQKEKLIFFANEDEVE